MVYHTTACTTCMPPGLSGSVDQGWYLYLVLPFSRLESQDFQGQSLDFLPERWLDEEGGLIKEPRLFIPFSEGVRHCIGWRLAMDESKVGGA